MGDLSAVVAAVGGRVSPDDEERARLDAAVSDLIERTETAAADLPVGADAVQVGSTARATWLAGDRDIDLFVRFPPDIDRERLEEYGLAVGHEVLPDSHEEYAEHPYVSGEFRGFDVDLVPCYDVETATEAQSAVDRTPFHTAYLEGRIDGNERDVRVCKQFLTAIGAYGSNLRTRGFSGYLTELLVVEHGGFEPLVEAAADWQPPVRFDPEDHGTERFDDPLVLVDPTDPERNVAAVCSAENVARLQHYARDLLDDPRVAAFEPREPPDIDADAVRAHLDRRGTTPVAVVFETPDIVDDQLYPQLRRSLSGVVGGLDARGFEPVRSTTVAGDRAVLLVELAVAERPAVERHEGPPVAVRDHAAGFYESYADPDGGSDGEIGVYGPFLDGDRYVVERSRTVTTAAEFLRSGGLFDVALGKRVAEQLRSEHEVLVGNEVARLADEFGTELGRYFEPVP